VLATRMAKRLYCNPLTLSSEKPEQRDKAAGDNAALPRLALRTEIWWVAFSSLKIVCVVDGAEHVLPAKASWSMSPAE
jgi:hypothetical protein